MIKLLFRQTDKSELVLMERVGPPRRSCEASIRSETNNHADEKGIDTVVGLLDAAV